MPGSLAFRTPEYAPGLPIGVPGIEFWLDLFGVFTLNGQAAATNAGTYVTTPDTWINLESGQVHGLHRFQWVINENSITFTLPATYMTQQLFLFDPVQSVFVSSNLLADYL